MAMCLVNIYSKCFDKESYEQENDSPIKNGSNNGKIHPKRSEHQWKKYKKNCPHCVFREFPAKSSKLWNL